MISSTPTVPSENVTSYTQLEEPKELNLAYTISEVLVALLAVVGNAVVIIVFLKERRLRRRTNYYIVSLAVADFLVGLLGIPFAILASVGLPTNLYACLFTVSLLVVLCTISIFCLVAVSVDRYWAILHPMGYSRHVRTKTALVIISICWLAGTIIGFLPLLGWNKGNHENLQCYFLEVMDYNYLVFLYFVTIITPSLLLAAFYTHIYRVVLKQLRQIVTMNPENGTSSAGRTSGGTMLRMLGAAQKREVKATQNLSIIVLFFMICWLPLYTINCIITFCSDCQINSTFMLFCIILSHLNSAGNPMLYAYHLRDFRAALKHFLYNLFGRGDQNISGTALNCRASFASNAYNNCNHQRIHSLPNSKLYSESQLSLFNKKSYTLPAPPKISTFVTNAAALAAATAGDLNREIWKISEGPSETSEPRVKRSASESSGKVNSGYGVGPVDCEEGDDDVFLDDNLPISNSNDSINKIISDRFKGTIVRTNCLSSSSPQLSRGVFLVEGERPPFLRSCSVAEKPERRKKISTTSWSGDQRLSPLKVVGEFLKKRGKHASEGSMTSEKRSTSVTTCS